MRQNLHWCFAIHIVFADIFEYVSQRKVSRYLMVTRIIDFNAKLCMGQTNGWPVIRGLEQWPRWSHWSRQISKRNVMCSTNNWKFCLRCWHIFWNFYLLTNIPGLKSIKMRLRVLCFLFCRNWKISKIEINKMERFKAYNLQATL